MSDITNASLNPPFGWWYSWLPIRELDGMPDFTASSVMKNPDTVKVTWRIQDPKGGKPWEYSAEIVPDYAYHGPEYAMVFIFSTFAKSIKEDLDS